MRLLCTANQRVQQGAVNELQIAATRKPSRIFGESARGHDESARCALCRHHTIKLAHHVHAHLVCLPLLALDKEFLCTFGKHEVNATIGTTATGF